VDVCCLQLLSTKKMRLESTFLCEWVDPDKAFGHAIAIARVGAAVAAGYHLLVIMQAPVDDIYTQNPLHAPAGASRPFTVDVYIGASFLIVAGRRGILKAIGETGMRGWLIAWSPNSQTSVKGSSGESYHELGRQKEVQRSSGIIFSLGGNFRTIKNGFEMVLCILEVGWLVKGCLKFPASVSVVEV
jgi:hypothetical protein